MNQKEKSLTDVAKHTAVVLAGISLVVAIAATIVIAKEFILLIFLGVLFGVFLTHCAGIVADRTPLNHGLSLAIVTILLFTVLGGGTALLGMKIENQLDKMSFRLDEASDKLESWLGEHPLAMQLFERVPYANNILKEQDSDSGSDFFYSALTEQRPSDGETTTNETSQRESDEGSDESSGSENSQAKEKSENDNSKTEAISTSAVKTIAGRTFSVFKKMFSTTLGLVANMGLIFFVGLFLAVDPSLYRDGFTKLFPNRHRERVADVMNQMAEAMFAWLNGRFVAMLITGAGTGAALWLLGVPLAFTIGVITALLAFIPNLGGIIALALAMLMAFTQGPSTVLWVIAIYTALQLIESNVITPLIQQHQTSIPPALLLAFQVIMGALTGFMGLLVATPLLAAGLVAVSEFWVKDVLGDEAAN